MIRSVVLAIGFAVVTACATSEAPRTSGFSANEAAARMAEPEAIDACTVRTGHLVIEIERVTIAEYPHHRANSGHAQQPIVLRYIGPPGHLDGAFWVAAARYHPGDAIDELRALRILDRPLRALGGTRLIVRLAENDSSGRPRWASRAETASGATDALGVVGLPSPASVLKDGIEIVRQLDRDDLILEWSIDPRDIVRALGKASAVAGPTAHVGVRYRLTSTRTVPPAGPPAAAMDLVAYREPEIGCP